MTFFVAKKAATKISLTAYRLFGTIRATPAEAVVVCGNKRNYTPVISHVSEKAGEH